MRSRFITVKVTHNVLVPGWIAAFGLVVLSTPPLGAAASLGLFVLAVCVIPGVVLLRNATGQRASHA